MLADRLGVPLLVTEHESGLPTRLASERARAAYRALFAPGRRVVAVSAVLARELTGLLGLPVGHVEVIPNTVDVEAFHPVGPEGRDPDELLWVGSRQASKGIDQLLVAFALARADRPTLRLRLIGRAMGEDDRLSARARELGLETAVRFEPPTDRPGVAAAMERAALFVHPSPRETFGVVAVEAIASGLPVAAMPSGGVDEILGRDGAYGEVAETPTAEALAVAIGRALNRRAGFDPASLRAHAETQYAAPAVAARLIALYRSMLPTLPGPDWAEDAAGLEASPFRVPSIVVGMRRALVIPRLVGLPAGLRGQLSVLTSAGSGPAEPTVDPPLGTFREIDAEAGFRAAQTRAGGPLAPAAGPVRVARAIRHPIRARNLRSLARARPEMARATRRRAIQEAILALPPGDRVEILPIDADDVELVAPLLDHRVVLHPNTLRGLADRIDGGEQPEPVGPPVMGGGSTADRSSAVVPGPT